MIRKCHNHTLKTTPAPHNEESHNNNNNKTPEGHSKAKPKVICRYVSKKRGFNIYYYIWAWQVKMPATPIYDAKYSFDWNHIVMCWLSY